MRRAERRSGFTLLELAMALAIGGFVLLGARLVLSQLARHGEVLLSTSTSADREANAQRLLRALARQSGSDGDSLASVSGSAKRAWFTTWCDVPSGWKERCAAMLAVDSVASRPTLALVLSTGEVQYLMQGFAHGRFIYLRDPSNGGVWLREWGSGRDLPVAIGIVLDSDTIIVRLGGGA